MVTERGANLLDVSAVDAEGFVQLCAGETSNPGRGHNLFRILAGEDADLLDGCRKMRSDGGDLCRRGPVIGFDLPGCFAERACLPKIALVKVDDRISDSEAACLQSLSDSVAAVETAGIRVGDCVAIFGQGSMGLECLQVARLSGAGLRG